MEHVPKPARPPDKPPIEGTFESAAEPADDRIRVVHLPLQPRTWLGKVALAIAGAAALVVALFFSILAVAVVLGVGVTAFAYLFWATRGTRRATREAARRQRSDTV